MENFEQIAEDCLAGKLSGTFILSDNTQIHSSKLYRNALIQGYYQSVFPYVLKGVTSYTKDGEVYSKHIKDNCDIINFIPDMKQQQIKIDIPEGKVPVMEQTESGVVITWKEKELTYDFLRSVAEKEDWIYKPRYLSSDSNISNNFFKKVEVLRKLTNIRNYFGGDKSTNSWLITIDSARRPFVIKNPRSYRENCFIYFETKEHAQAAIDMLGDELKYLFEPW